MADNSIDGIIGTQTSTTDGFIASISLAPEGHGSRNVKRPLRLLIVEDDYFTAFHSQAALEATGYQIVGMAGSFEEAVRTVDAERPDLVIMDIRLAGPKDGIDAARVIMERFGIPCLFVSAYTDDATRSRAAPAQPLGWLSKPFTVAQLIERVRAAADQLPRSKR